MSHGEPFGSDPNGIIQHIPKDSPQGIYYQKGQIIQLPNGKKYLLTDKGWELIEENPK